MALLASSVWVWQRNGAYGFNVLARRGGTYWTRMGADDARLPPSMREALKDTVPDVVAGSFAWREVEPGYEIAELPVTSAGSEVDRILLNRIDPKRFRFVAQSDGSARVRDLSHSDWQGVLAGARNAMVSYPLLLGEDGQTHVNVKSRWLANRTFVAQDRAGRILIGTTKEAFFSLDRMANFLKASPLELSLALNLDGGPIACQSVRLNGFQRKFYAQWEAQVNEAEARGSEVNLLRWPLAQSTWAMPVVLAVERAH